MERTPRDVPLICAAAFARAVTAGCVGVLLGILLGNHGYSTALIGAVVGLGIAGGAAMTVVVMRYADRAGRRRTLIILSFISAAGLAGIVIAPTAGLLLAVAFAGMVNGMGRDRGPAGTLEQAMLPAATTAERRTWVLAWYNVTLDAGHATGAALAALPTLLQAEGWLQADSHRIVFFGCAFGMAATTIAYAFCSPVVELADTSTTTATTADPVVRQRVVRIAGLFGIDSVGGGFLSSALIAYWFLHRYAMTETAIAALFFGARVLNALSHVGAAWLAKRFGLLNTMVFTHLPSSLFLLAAPLSPSAPLAAALFLAREGLVEMDVPTRQSYVMAVVPPADRTFASGLTNLTRTGGWAAGAAIGGTAMQQVTLAAPLVIGGVLKIVYDIVLYRSFRHVRPPEERPRQAASGTVA